jgi:hypothetical protein
VIGEPLALVVVCVGTVADLLLVLFVTEAVVEILGTAAALVAAVVVLERGVIGRTVVGFALGLIDPLVTLEVVGVIVVMTVAVDEAEIVVLAFVLVVEVVVLEPLVRSFVFVAEQVHWVEVPFS